MSTERVLANNSLFPLIEGSLRALSYGPTAEEVADQADLERHELGALIHALLHDPEPISPATFVARVPYAAETLFEPRLAGVARKGYLKPVGEKGYRLTEQGRAVVETWINAARDHLAGLRPLPEIDLERLAALLARVVRATLAAPKLPERPILRASRRLDPGPGAPTMVRLDQYLTDLAAYRDDAHIAAWRARGFNGPAIEVLTLLWRGEAASLDDLCQTLAHRGHPREVYARIVEELRERGYVAAGQTTMLIVTAQGREVRQAVEDLTDHYFYEPWDCLDEEEIAPLRALLTRLHDALQRGRE